jgi:hypothetical protein
MIIQVDNSSVMVWDSLRKNPASYQNLQYLFQDMLLLTHHLSLIFLRAWQKFIAEKEGEFNLTITFYNDYPVCNPNNNFRFEKI